MTYTLQHGWIRKKQVKMIILKKRSLLSSKLYTNISNKVTPVMLLCFEMWGELLQLIFLQSINFSPKRSFLLLDCIVSVGETLHLKLGALGGFLYLLKSILFIVVHYRKKVHIWFIWNDRGPLLAGT